MSGLSVNNFRFSKSSDPIPAEERYSFYAANAHQLH
jgi:hypothetical protein